MPQQTKIFRVFISSTFNDMKLERNLLRKKVFPELEQLCRVNGARFQAIDLRWGVSEESQRNQKTMEICLNEIRRCQQLSPKPNFLILLGDRYGWQPVPANIPEAEMEKLSPHLSIEAKSLVKDWYKLDKNAIPAEYVLQPWGDRIAEYKDWEPIEKQLRDALRKAALKAELDDDALIKYTASATHQEIIQGALNPPADVKNPEEHVFALSRTINNLPTDERAEGFIDLDNGKQDTYSQSQLELLKEDLNTKLGDNNFIDYSVDWHNGTICFDRKNGFTEQDFVDRTLNHLKRVIEEQLKDIVDEDEVRMEIRYHKEFAESLTPHFTGRQSVLDEIQNYIKAEKNQKVLSLVGASGSGKTSVMAKAIELVEQNNAVLVYRFIGANAKSSNLLSLLSSVCSQIANAFNTTLEKLAEEFQKEKLHEYNTLVDLFRKCLALATENKPLVLFLDALDQLSETDNALDLNWLPKELPTYSRVIASCLPELEGKLQDTQIYQLPVMPPAEGETLLNNWLSAHKRQLTPEQKKDVLQKFRQTPLPLYLKLAFEQARQWHSYSPQQDIFDTVPVIIEKFFAVLEKEHSPMLVAKAVGYMLSGKDKGLTVDEILDMLVFDKEYWEYFLAHSHPNHKAEVEKAGKLPVVVWSRLFMDLAPYLTERDSFGERLIGFYHRQFNEVLIQKYLTENKIAHQKLAEYFVKQPHFLDGDRQKKPNVRKCIELPWLQTKGEMWDDVTETLCDLDFIQAKCAAKMTYDLVKDYNYALDNLPEAQPKREKEKKRQERIEKYTRDLIAYAKGEIKELDIPQSVKPWTFKIKQEDLTGINSNYSNFEQLSDFSHFVTTQTYPLITCSDNKNFVIQHAYNCFSTGSIVKIIDEYINKNRFSVLLLNDEKHRDNLNRYQALIRTMVGHNGPVKSINMTSNSKIAVSSGWDNTLRLWDLENGLCKKTFRGHLNYINSAKIFSKNNRVISASRDTTIKIWDTQTGENIKTLFGHTDSVEDICITFDEKRAISVSRDTTIRIWDLVNFECEKIIPIQSPDACQFFFDVDGMRSQNSIQSVSVTINGAQFIISSYDGSIHVFNLLNFNLIKSFKAHEGHTLCTKFFHNNEYAISSGSDNIIKIWDLKNYTCVAKLIGHCGPVNRISITHDGNMAISASDDSTLRLWNLRSNECLKIFIGHSGKVNDVMISLDGKYALSSGSDGKLMFWELETSYINNVERNDVKKIAYIKISGDNTKICYASDNSIKVLELLTEKKMNKLDGHSLVVSSLDIAPLGNKILSTSWDRTIKLWNLGNYKCEETFLGHTYFVKKAIFSPDNRQIISAGWDTHVKVWDIAKGDPINTLIGHKAFVNNIDVTPDGDVLISSDHDKVIKLWNLKTYSLIKTLWPTLGYVNCVKITPSGRFVLYSSDNIIFLKELEFDNKIFNFEQHTMPILYILITQDERFCVSVDSNTIFIWDIISKEIIGKYYTHDSISSFEYNYTLNVIILGFLNGDIKKIHTKNIFSSVPFCTLIRYWNNIHKMKQSRWERNIMTMCKLCGKRFIVGKDVIRLIKEIHRDAGVTEDQSPCLQLPNEVWDETSLISECPKCHKPLRFNPFIVDNSDKY